MSENLNNEEIKAYINGLEIQIANYISTNSDLLLKVERLESDLKLEKENEDRLVRLWQTANNEVHAQRSQIAALIDNQTRLNSLIANREQS